MRLLDMQERDALAAQMRAHYEAGKPHRPRAAPFDITADNLMLGLLEIAEKALRTTPPGNQDAMGEVREQVREQLRGLVWNCRDGAIEVEDALDAIERVIGTTAHTYSALDYSIAPKKGA